MMFICANFTFSHLISLTNYQVIYVLSVLKFNTCTLFTHLVMANPEIDNTVIAHITWL